MIKENHTFGCYLYDLIKTADFDYFSGLFLDVDSDDDMELSPFEQLENSLNQLEMAVQYLCGNTEETPKFNGELSALDQLEDSLNQLSRFLRNPVF